VEAQTRREDVRGVGGQRRWEAEEEGVKPGQRMGGALRGWGGGEVGGEEEEEVEGRGLVGEEAGEREAGTLRLEEDGGREHGEEAGPGPRSTEDDGCRGVGDSGNHLPRRGVSRVGGGGGTEAPGEKASRQQRHGERWCLAAGGGGGGAGAPRFVWTLEARRWAVGLNIFPRKQRLKQVGALFPPVGSSSSDWINQNPLRPR
jgi:hypothetical protein